MHLSTHPTSYPTRYQEIAAKLEQELRQHYRCGDYLPAEQQLAARFEVNRHTLRRAIDQLVEKGWVQRRQGVGVLVLLRVNKRRRENLIILAILAAVGLLTGLALDLTGLSALWLAV